MRRKYFDIDPANVDPNGIAENQTLGAAGNLTLDGALCDLGTAAQFDIGDSYSAGIGGVQIAIDSAGDVSSVVFTVTGKDQDGISRTETITGVTTTAVEGTIYWSQITQIAADAAVASNVFVGPVDEIITKTMPLNWRDHEAVTVAVSGLTGTVQFDIDETFDNLDSGLSSINWITKQSNQTADVSASLSLHATGVRLKVDSYTDTAELQFMVLQN